MSDTPMSLVRPSREHLASYVAALERGWSSDGTPGSEWSQKERRQIETDADTFLSNMDDREAKGPSIVLPDGSSFPRIPGWKRWMWDDEFAGSIGFRWQPGTCALPPWCLGHIGYGVVPWKQGRGYAKRALALVLPDARAEGLDYVELTTDPDNLASQRVIEANGGALIERFIKPPQYGSTPGLRYRIDLT